MTARAFQSGHQVVYQGGAWRYEDTGMLATQVRPCARCGELPTPEGHDACLGHIKGVTAACCGHGVEEPYQTPAKRLYCHQLAYGYSIQNCCAFCHGTKKEPVLIEYTLTDENVAVVCGGAAEFLHSHGLLKPGQRSIHGCAWRSHEL